MKISFQTLLLLFLPLLAPAQEVEETMADVEEEAPTASLKISIPAHLKTGKPERFVHQRLFGYVLNDSILIPPEYKELEKPYTDFIIARNPRNYFGAINQKGEVVLPFEYIILSRTACGVVLAAKQGLGYGLLDSLGRVLVPLEYRYGHHFADSIVVLHSPGKQKIIKITGAEQIELVLESQFEAISKETTGNRPIFTVQENGLWGLMDYQKNTILPCAYDKIHRMYDDQIIAEKDGKWGVVNFQGRVLIPFVHDKINERLRYGYYRIGKSLPKGKWLWGLADTTGRIVLQADYESVEQLYYCDFFKVGQAGKKGLVDTAGVLIVPIQFGEIYQLKHPDWTVQQQHPRFVRHDAYGLYVKTQNPDNDLLGLWDLDKGEILKPVYEWIEILQVGGPYSIQQAGKKALFDGNGEALTGFEFNWLGYTPLRPELITAGLPDQKMMLLHRSDGTPLEPDTYDELLPFHNSNSAYFGTKKDRLAALHAPNGQRLTPYKYGAVMFCEKPANLEGLPAGRTIVACAIIYSDQQGPLFFALDDTGKEYAYTPN